jgi:hypothetical protein
MKTFTKFTAILLIIMVWSFSVDLSYLGAEAEDCVYESCDTATSVSDMNSLESGGEQKDEEELGTTSEGSLEGPENEQVGEGAREGSEESMTQNNEPTGSTQSGTEDSSLKLIEVSNTNNDESTTNNTGGNGGSGESNSPETTTGQTENNFSTSAFLGAQENTTQVVHNSCAAANTLGDVTVENTQASGEKTLQTMLSENGYNLDVTTDQTQYQLWGVAEPGVTIEVESIDRVAAYNHVFGYYANGLNSFVPVFKTADIAGYESVPMWNAGPFTINFPSHGTLGFAIKAYGWGEEGLKSTTATENSLNEDGKDKVITYNPDNNGFVLAFEDWTDFDYNDLVLQLDFNCGEVPPPPTDVCPNIDGTQTSVPEGYHLENGQCVQDTQTSTTLKVVKKIDADGSLATTNDQTLGVGWDFVSEYWWNGATKTTGVDGSIPSTLVTPSAVSHGITETVKSGYTLFAASCTGSTGPGNLDSVFHELSVHIDAGQTVVCTFYNKPTSQPTDVCPNIDGTQTSVPEGYHLENGQCVQDTQEPPVENSCPAPSALSDTTVETIGDSGEKTLQQILNDAGYSLNVITDQKQYQIWNVEPNSEVVIEAESIDHISAYASMFGYYTDGIMSTFVPIFKRGNIVGSESIPAAEDGPFTVNTGEADTIGFAIVYFNGDSEFQGVSATQVNLTTGGGDKVLVYNSAANKYVLGFEDWADNDYQDLVVKLDLGCDELAQNVAPIANAGPDRDITLPINFTTLDGSGSSDPDGVITSFVWTQVSGPSQIEPADSVVPTVNNLVVGTYVFKLVVTDNDGATDDDTMQVVVHPQVVNPPQCSDTVDNADPEDTLIDAADPGCHTDGNAGNPNSYDPNDNDETNSGGGGGGGDKPECSDDVDNADAEDTLVDEADPGCHTDGNAGNSSSYNPNDDDESNTIPQCSDGVDNADTEDTLADAQDPGCHTDGNPNNGDSYNPNDNDESNSTPECSDGVDNADPEDTLIDAADPGCHTDGDADNSSTYNPNDNDESDDVCPNISGVQTEIPDRMHKNSRGNCISNTSGGGGSRRSSGGGGRAALAPQVLGASTSCGIYVDKYLRIGYVNDVEAVKKVQSFLNMYMNAGLVVDGFYGPLTEGAVRQFQLARNPNVLTPWGITESTGIFYLTTQTETNNIMCPPLELPIPSPLINWSQNNTVTLPPPLPL